MDKHALFKKIILHHSDDKTDYMKAVEEWECIDYYIRAEADGECICTKPIKREYTIKNTITNAELIIGCVCVKQIKRDNKKLSNQMNMMRFNEEAEKNDLLARRCLDCYKIYKIDDLHQHNWKQHCFNCWRRDNRVH